ncbi:hypothetical protein Q0812_10605 [Brevundimonas sp. 2R-24]|uniref:Lipoprotein n=1 Tax=Peiella sedimenti TaxID=3061083 RepID=A0ABT8SMR9_9CAUL|nr:hypothetical protein [Caulobacteraceae bacterium XZ-24]
MTSVVLRRLALAGACVSLLALAACETPAPEAPPPPPPPPPLPTVALSSSVTDAASAYLTYMRQAAAQAPGFQDAQAIQNTLQVSASYEPGQMSRGVIAYAAVLALQDREFVQAVRELGRDPTVRAEMVRQLAADPAYAAQLPGAASAAGLVVAQLNADGQAVLRAGQAVKQDAYDIQRNSDPRHRWARRPVEGLQERLDRTKALSARSMAPDAQESARLYQAAHSGLGLSVVPGRTGAPYTPVVARGLALAALAALGEAGESNQALVDALLVDTDSPFCMNMAKLNLFQCLAVSRPNFEDVFCLAQHGLMDTGQCVMNAAGAVLPVEFGPPAVSLASNEGAAAQAEQSAQTAAGTAAGG